MEKFYDAIFDEHPYGYHPTREDFSKLTTDDVAGFHAQYFVPANMTLAIAGDIDTSFAEGFLDEWSEQVPSSRRPAKSATPAIRGSRAEQHSFRADKLQSWLVFGHDLPIVPDDEQAALEVMNYILAGGHLWTRMTIETRYKYGYTNDASGFLEPHWYGPGSYNFRSYSRPEVIEAIYDNMMDEVYRIRAEEVSDEELFVAKGALTDGGFPVQYLDGYATARTLALEQLRYGNHDRSKTYIDRIRDVSKEDVLQAAKKYLRPDEMQVILMGQDTDLLK